MNTLSNLAIIGSSHIASQSIAEVKKAVAEYCPDIIALELDKARFTSILYENNKAKQAKQTGKQASQEKEDNQYLSIKTIGLKGYLFAKIAGFAQKKLGQYVGINPGDEMRTAMRLAEAKNIQIALIDRDIRITLKRFSEELSMSERLNFVWDIISAPFSRKKISFDLHTVPEKKIINEMMREVKIRYPNIYKVLISERNEFMARKLARIMQTNPDKRILAIVGAGHEDEILDMVKKNCQSSVSYSYKYCIGSA